MNKVELKEILENIQTPQRLDSHPWVSAHFVSNSSYPGSPGEKLVRAVLAMFRETMPGVPPRRGVRLDTRWAEFGLLAAQYFSPVEFGTVAPGSLRDAWAHIDRAILLFVHGNDKELTKEQVETYKLIGDESSVAPDSTLSDWHRKGVEKLVQAIQAREHYLIRQAGNKKPVPAKKETRNVKRWVTFSLLVFFLILIILGGVKASRIYKLAQIVVGETRELQDLAGSPSMETLMDAGPMLSKTRQDFSALEEEVSPFLRFAPLFGWVPTYGGDIASSPQLIEITHSMLASADMSYQAGAPLLDNVLDSSGEIVFDPPKLLGLLDQISPEMIAASHELQTALTAREHLDVDQLSPRAKNLIADRVDPLLGMMQDGLTLAVELPRVAGASTEGPKTYLLLVQNEDELRPTGGFITAASSVVVRNGQPSDFDFEDSGNLDVWDQPYPSAPWQLSEYMNSPVMVFRDANWFTDYPRSALYAENLYAYAKIHSVDGVIAFDQHLLVELLRVVGPIQVEGTDEPVNAGNVVSYMRESKIRSADNLATPGWFNKLFMNKISFALLKKVFSGDVPVEKLAQFAVKVLDERHLMLQFDNEGMADFLARRDWDGIIRPGNGDFLMVVDSNIGFNKTNAMVNIHIAYTVDLVNPAVPVAQVEVEHTNYSSHLVPCGLRDRVTLEGQKAYPVDRCYWDYLRIYTRDHSGLLQANPQSVPAEWMLRGQAVSAHVDTLDEGLDGISTYGLLKVVPGKRTVVTKLRYVLPVEILSIRPGTRQVVYHLRVKKQPGTIAVPIDIAVHLPEGVDLVTVPDGAYVEDEIVHFAGDLRTDLEFEVIFEVP